jgi:hypothetical protein
MKQCQRLKPKCQINIKVQITKGLAGFDILDFDIHLIFGF